MNNNTAYLIFGRHGTSEPCASEVGVQVNPKIARTLLFNEQNGRESRTATVTSFPWLHLKMAVKCTETSIVPY